MRRSVVPLFVILGLLLAACGPAVLPSNAPTPESGETFVVGLPPLVVTFDDAGKPGVEGVPIEAIAASLGQTVALPSIDPYYVNWMQQANIQHIELRQTGDGLALLVNGKMMPHMVWKDGSLQAASEMARLVGGPQGAQIADMMQKLAPILQRLGLSIVVKFPAAEGAEAIPLAGDEVVMAEPATPDGPPMAVAQFEVKYDDQGVPSIMGISARDLEALLGHNGMALALAPSVIAQAQSSNIQNLELRSKGDGLYAYINGVAMPNIVWDKQMLSDAVDVYGKMNNVPSSYVDLIKQYLPLLARTDLAVMIQIGRAHV